MAGLKSNLVKEMEFKFKIQNNSVHSSLPTENTLPDMTQREAAGAKWKKSVCWHGVTRDEFL